MRGQYFIQFFSLKKIIRHTFNQRESRIYPMLSAYVLASVLLLLLLSISPVESSHFVGGTITWRIENATPNGTLIAIRLSQTYLWTYNSAKCNSTTIAANQPALGSGGLLSCSPSCPTGFTSVSTQVFCTDGSLPNDIGVGQRSDVFWLPINISFSTFFASGAWGSQVLGGSTWSVLTHINLLRRSDNGLFNNPPVSNIVSPVNVYSNQIKTITLPVSDADGDNVRCRWATSNGTNECGSVCPPGSLPPNTTLHSNCTIEIIGLVTTSQYAITLMVCVLFKFIRSSSPLFLMPI